MGTDSLPQSTRLLSIPREIRDEIYLQVLQSARPSSPPTSPAAAGPRTEECIHRAWSNRSLFYPNIQSPYGLWSPMLLTNRQTNAEIRDLIASAEFLHRQQAFPFKLDCMVEGFSIWPTWTLFPALVARMGVLEVDLRFLDAKLNSCLFYGDGGPGLLFRPLFRLLNGLFLNGPQFLERDTTGGLLHLELLVVNVVLPPFAPDDNISPDNWAYALGFLKGSMHQIAISGALSGRIGRMRICDGKEDRDIEIAEIEFPEELANYWARYGFEWGRPCS